MTHWCNKKTISDKVKFVPKPLIDLEEEFYDEDGILYEETVIESTYSINEAIASLGSVKTYKIGGRKRASNGFRGATDGVLKFFLGEKYPEFYGIQECKIGIKSRESSAYNKQITQLLGYWCQKSLLSSKVLIANSETYFDIMFVDENEDYLREIRPELLKGLEEYSPHCLYKHCIIPANKLKIHRYNIKSKEDLADLLEIIYRRCTHSKPLNFEENA